MLGTMIRDNILKLRENLILNKINDFFHSKWYVVAIALLSVLCCLFGFELITYYIVMSIIIFGTLFLDGGTYLISPIIFMYITLSRKHNTIQVYREFEEQLAHSIFSDNNFLIQFFIIVGIISLCILVRFIYAILTKKYVFRPKLILGVLLLTLAYIIGGIGSDFYNIDTAIFGLLEGICLIIPYVVILYTVDIDNLSKDYLPFVLIILSGALMIETVSMYVYGGFFGSEGGFNRGNLYTGWGWYNNVGGLLVMTQIATLYYIFTKKDKAYLFILLQFASTIFVVLTQSRGSIITSFIFDLVTIVLIFIKLKKKDLIYASISLGAILIVVVTGIIIFKDLVLKVFASLFEILSTDTFSSVRFKIWDFAINSQFASHKVFGVGFYEASSAGAPTFSLLPARYHNNYIQLLASSGIFGLLMYLVHRVEANVIVFKKWNTLSLSIFLLGLLYFCLNLFDCHSFNMGPSVIYMGVMALYELHTYHRTN